MTSSSAKHSHSRAINGMKSSSNKHVYVTVYEYIYNDSFKLFCFLPVALNSPVTMMRRASKASKALKGIYLYYLFAPSNLL